MAGWLLVWQPRDAIPPDRRGDVIIHYWEKWNGLEGVAIQQVVDDFNNSVGKEKHIYVDLLSMSNIDQKTLVATAAGVPPDVAGLWDSNDRSVRRAGGARAAGRSGGSARHHRELL